MSIIAGTFKGIAERLRERGFVRMVDVKWIKQPRRENGRWSCEVAA